MNPSPTRILIADDHAVVRRGLQQILGEAFPQAAFGEAGTTQEALQKVWQEPWNLVLLDLSMPGRSGLDIVKDLKDAQPRLPVLILSVHAEDQFAIRALRAGAAGYVTKESAPDELARAAEKVLGGGRYVCAALAEKLALRVAESPDRPRHESLSDREFEVLRLIAAGKAVKQIAAELSLSVKTISTYRTRLLQKLALATNAELTRYALSQGLVQ